MVWYQIQIRCISEFVRFLELYPVRLSAKKSCACPQRNHPLIDVKHKKWTDNLYTIRVVKLFSLSQMKNQRHLLRMLFEMEQMQALELWYPRLSLLYFHLQYLLPIKRMKIDLTKSSTQRNSKKALPGEIWIFSGLMYLNPLHFVLSISEWNLRYWHHSYYPKFLLCSVRVHRWYKYHRQTEVLKLVWLKPNSF